MASPSEPVIDPSLSETKHNPTAPKRGDASDDEDQADTESESSGSENSQGIILT